MNLVKINFRFEKVTEYKLNDTLKNEMEFTDLGMFHQEENDIPNTDSI